MRMRLLLSPTAIAEGFGPKGPCGSVTPPGTGATVSCDRVFRIGHVLLECNRAAHCVGLQVRHGLRSSTPAEPKTTVFMGSGLSTDAWPSLSAEQDGDA